MSYIYLFLITGSVSEETDVIDSGKLNWWIPLATVVWITLRHQTVYITMFMIYSTSINNHLLRPQITQSFATWRR